MSLASRLTIAMIALVVLTAAGVGLLTYRSVVGTVVPIELRRLALDTRWLAADLSTSVGDVRADIHTVRGAAAIDAMLRAQAAGGLDPMTGLSEQAWRDQLSRLLVAALEAHPNYLQFRLIGTADGGREIVRVQRPTTGGPVRVVPEAELQRKGDRAYFQEAIRTSPDETYLSPIELNREGGVLEKPHVPLLRAAMTVPGTTDRPFGILIINVDMRPSFERLRAQAPAGGEIYLVDERGDFLIHPDRTLEFRLDRGLPLRFGEDFPIIAKRLTETDGSTPVVRDPIGERHGAAAATVRLAGGPKVSVVTTLPHSILNTPARPIGRSSLLAGLVSAACATVVATLVARSLTRPLVKMARTVGGFTGEGPVAMPTTVGGEIGLLAQAFTRMALEVRERASALRSEIDERRRVEAELRRYAETERLFLAVVNTSGDAISTYTLDGTVTAWNPGAERLFGYSAAEMMGRSISILMPSDRKSELAMILERLHDGRGIEQIETVRVAKDGREVEVSVSVTPLRSSAGEVVGGAGIARDISERKLAEKKLRQYAETERLFLAMIETSDDAILTKNLDGLITAWNPGAERMFGYNADEAIGQSINIIVPPDRRAEVSSILDRLKRNERIEHYETVRVTKSGQQLDVSLSISPLMSANGEIVGGAKIARDISDKKVAERKFQIAVESCPSGMIMVDRTGAMILVNAEAERLFGYSREELLGQSVDMLVPERSRAGHKEKREAFCTDSGTQPARVERTVVGRRKDGSEFPIDVRLNLIQTWSGPLVLSVIVDISERVKAREALEEQTRELQRSNDDLEQFAYVASHDLREPLRMVASYAELLAERYRGRLDQSADKYIDYTLEGARRMQQLITDLLAFSRIGTQSRPMQPTDVTGILERVIRNVHALIEDSGATIVAGDLPTVVADESQLTQVFQNLVGNAVKFRSEERPPRVEVTAERRKGLWAFRVADNGIGIAPHHAERVFQMFQRLHERGRYDGSGIGLAIAKKIIERHGGRLWLESAVDEGSTFYFTIPDPEKRRSNRDQERAA